MPNALGGQDGYYSATKGTALSYTDNGDGTITDEVTGLMWKKCSEGYNEADNCLALPVGAVAKMDWETALVTCEADETAEYTDWRLPNIRELSSIINYGNEIAEIPTIDNDFFPNTRTSYYWSSTTSQYVGCEFAAWRVLFDDGSTNYNGKGNTEYVRCVRG
jgi:hypothetical protein